MKTLSLQVALLAIALSLAPSWGATNWYFGPGTVSAAACAESMSGNNVSSNNSGNFLVFDDAGTYNVNLIGLRNTNLEGVDSAVYVQSGTVNIADYLALGTAVNARGTMQISGGSVAVTNAVFIANGSGSSAVFTMSGGALSASMLTMGQGANAVANATLSGGTFTVSGNTTISSGVSASSTLWLTGATLKTNTVTVGRATDSVNNFIQTAGIWTSSGVVNLGCNARAATTYSLSGGTFSADALLVGPGAGSTNDILVSDNGYFRVVGTATIGQSANSINTVRVSGGTLTASALLFGRTNTVTSLIEQTGGAIYANSVSMTFQNNSTTSYTMSGGTLTNANFGMAQQVNSKAYWDLSGSAKATVSSALNIATGATAQATVTVGGNAALVAGNITVGYGANATGSYVQTGGNTTVGNFNIANASGATGNVAVSGGTTSVTTGMRVGLSVAGGTTSANYTQTGGNVVANWIAFAANTQSTSTILVDATVSGGRLVSNNHIDIGANNTDMGTNSANVTVSGTGALQAANGISVLRGGNLFANRVYVSAEKTAAAGEVGTGYFRTAMGGNATLGTLENASGEIYVQDASTITAQNLSLSGVAATATVGVQSGVLTVSNALTLGSALAGETADAQMYVSAPGTLQANAVTVQGGATLAVSGTLSAASMTLDAGANAGMAQLAVHNGAALTATGNVVLGDNAAVTLYLGSGFAAVDVGGILDFASETTSVLTLDFAGLENPTGDTVLFAAANGVSGFDAWYTHKEANVVVTGLAEGYTFDGLSLGADGRSLIATVSVPEPSAAAALLGLLGLVCVARRRR